MEFCQRYINYRQSRRGTRTGSFQIIRYNNGMFPNGVYKHNSEVVEFETRMYAS